ncbi:MAG: hypothetical protein NT041_01220 [Candidatus Vogelbacteria bacterium]|nr:hypothetical protein [Candidatus Vogelbacteria bacterium]
MKSTKYQVVIEPFAQRHFIKFFAKKYHSAWEFTFRFIKDEFEKIDLLFLKNTAETIVDSAEIKICKTEFKIAGTPESRHSSGNRCIVAVHKNTNKVCVLLVYHKNDLGRSNETTSWKKLIKENYPEYRDYLA